MNVSTLKCPNCGASVSAGGAPQCAYCGSAIIVKRDQASAPIKAPKPAAKPAAQDDKGELPCAACGHLNNAKFIFCSGCGGRLTAPST